jgi:hypothetical protein
MSDFYEKKKLSFYWKIFSFYKKKKRKMDTPNELGSINIDKVDDISNALWLSLKQGPEPGQFFIRNGKPINQVFINEIPYKMMQELIEQRITPRETSIEPEIFIDGTPFEASNEEKQQKIVELMSLKAPSSSEKLVFQYRHFYTMKYIRDNFIPYAYTTRHATIQGLEGIDAPITVNQFLQNYLIPAFKMFKVEPSNPKVVFINGLSINYQHNIVFKGDVNKICKEWIKTMIDEYSPKSAIYKKHTLLVQEDVMDPASLNFKRIPFICICYMWSN